MADEEIDDEGVPQKGGKKGILIGLALSVLLGGAAFYAVYSGLVFSSGQEMAKKDDKIEQTDTVAFVAIDPLIISLGQAAQYQLRFQAQIEVHPEAQSAVQNVMPRILDVLNSYLRAVDLEDIKRPASLLKLRGQMLRRIELVTGKGHVKDLLITEFVLS